MPAYAAGVAQNPLQAIYPGGIGAIVWAAERPLTNAVSLAVVLAGAYENVSQGCSFEVLFAGAPGAFEIDIQDADTDEDAAYASIPNAILNAVNAGNYARYELSPIKGKFIRALMKTQSANAVNITRAKFTR